MERIRVGSDFSGVGSFDFAIQRVAKQKQLDIENVFACDMDKYARESYLANHEAPGYYPDNVYSREIPAEPLDIYMTSPPCQAFSLSGLRKGKDDQRGILFFNSHEFIQKNKPRFFIFENVPGLISDDNGRTFGEWIRMLGGKSVNGVPIIFPDEESVPYHIYYANINSKDFNIPQNRDRVFIIGIRDDLDNNFRFPKTEYPTRKLNSVLEDQVDDKFIVSEKMLEKISYTGKRTGVVADLNKGGQKGTVYSYNSNHISCLTATDYKQPKQIMTRDKIIRRITPKEAFRLMDFPEDFKFVVSNTQLYKQAGNSIVVKVLEKILLNLNL